MRPPDAGGALYGAKGIDHGDAVIVPAVVEIFAEEVPTAGGFGGGEDGSGSAWEMLEINVNTPMSAVAKSFIPGFLFWIHGYCGARKFATTAPLLRSSSSSPWTWNPSTEAMVLAYSLSSSINSGGPAILVLMMSPMVTVSWTNA